MQTLRSHHATVTTMPAYSEGPRTVHPVDQQTPENRAQELTALLQTTLDLEELISLFAERTGSWLHTDGLRYRDAAQRIDLVVGHDSGHRATYQLVVLDEQLGTVEFRRGQPFSETELQDLEGLLCSLVYPLRNALSYRHAVEQALRDPLTGVQNRAALAMAVEREVEHAHRHGTPLAMLVIDIDHFKPINDTYGHSFGDDVIRAVTHNTENTIRKSDQLFRFGGEEFVVLASHTDEQGARQLAERIRRAIQAMDFVKGTDIGITVSLGIALMPPGESSEQLFERADRALYQAKQNGRNRWEIAD